MCLSIVEYRYHTALDIMVHDFGSSHNNSSYFYKQKIQLKADDGKSISDGNILNETEAEFVSIFDKFAFEITEEQKSLVKYYWGNF